MVPALEIEHHLRGYESRLWQMSRWASLWLALLLPIPALAAGAGFRYLLVPVGLAGAIAALAWLEPPSSRRVIASLGIIGFAWSLTILLALQWMQHSAGLVVLGPDGVSFLGGAHRLATSGFTLPQPSYEYFGTYATGHYFLFASLLYSLGPTLFNLQVFNCAAAAMLGPLTFAWTRALSPRDALAAGLLVTIFPSLVYLAAVDLWKDSSVIFASTLAIWALTHVASERRVPWLFGFGLIAGGCFWYLHVSRFYPFVYIEIGLLAAAALALSHRRRIAAGSVAAVVLAVVIGEASPAALGWPSSPAMFLTSIAHTMNTPSMKYFTAGLLDRLSVEGADALGDSPKHKLESLPDFQVGLMAPVSGESSHGGSRSSRGASRPPSVSRSTNVLQTEIETNLSTPATFGSISWAAQVIRRLYGPFVWILPPSLSASGWLSGLYLMYPGMLFWYAMFPFMLVGLLDAGWGILRGRQPFVLGVVWVYTTLYSLQFIAINLPARQREAMFPVLAVFGVMGYHWTHGRRWWTGIYIAYWVGLIGMAVAHLMVRARMFS